MKISFLFILLGISAQTLLGQKTDSTLSITITGDVMLDRSVRKLVGDRTVSFLFEKVDTFFKQTDFTIINMESAVTDTGTATQKRYKFKADSKWLKDLKDAGITHLDVANNHAFDYKMDGFQRTVKNIQNYDLEILGIRDSQKAPIKLSTISKNKNDVVILAATIFKLEAEVTSDSLPIPAVSLISIIANQVKDFKKEFPKIPIIVLLHWGIEYELIPSEKQQKEAQLMIDLGADLVIGHHPHILQQIDFYKGKPIIYSLGNFIFDQKDANTKESMFIQLFFQNNQLDHFFVRPIRLINFTPTPISTRNATFMKPILKNIEKRVTTFNFYYNIGTN